MAFMGNEISCIGGYGNKALEVKLLMETAKLNGITVNDELFNRIFDTIYNNQSKIVVDERTTSTRTQTEKA